MFTTAPSLGELKTQITSKNTSKQTEGLRLMLMSANLGLVIKLVIFQFQQESFPHPAPKNSHICPEVQTVTFVNHSKKPTEED